MSNIPEVKHRKNLEITEIVQWFLESLVDWEDYDYETVPLYADDINEVPELLLYLTAIELETWLYSCVTDSISATNKLYELEYLKNKGKKEDDKKN